MKNKMKMSDISHFFEIIMQDMYLVISSTGKQGKEEPFIHMEDRRPLVY